METTPTHIHSIVFAAGRSLYACVDADTKGRVGNEHTMHLLNLIHTAAHSGVFVNAMHSACTVASSPRPFHEMVSLCHTTSVHAT